MLTRYSLSSDCLYKTFRITFVSENHEIIRFGFLEDVQFVLLFLPFCGIGIPQMLIFLVQHVFFGRDCPRTFDSKSMTTEDAAAAV